MLQDEQPLGVEMWLQLLQQLRREAVLSQGCLRCQQALCRGLGAEGGLLFAAVPPRLRSCSA